ncbi:MAG: DUF4013 domain-containing protein [Chloroflexota bacterium]|nr:DUF4013 domain-containing protein [Chloroflexota bacterium]
MDFGLAFSYVFKEEDWFKKIAIPALCSLIPIIGPMIVSGWSLKATKNVIDGNAENALPDLDFGADLGRGFMAVLITAIYNIPVAIFVAAASGLFAAGGNADQAISVVFFILGGCAGLIGLLLGLLVIFLNVVAIANFVATGEFGAAFRFKELFKMLKSFGAWALAVLGSIIGLGLIAPLGMIACGIGALLTTAYGSAVYAHLLGQAYVKSHVDEVEVVEIL